MSNIYKEAADLFIQAAGVDEVAKAGGVVSSTSLPTTTRAYVAIHALDQGLVGTPDYLGLAFFWGQDYKHELRAATPKQRKRVHDAFLKAGLSLGGESPRHAAIVKKHLGKLLRKVYG